MEGGVDFRAEWPVFEFFLAETIMLSGDFNMQVDTAEDTFWTHSIASPAVTAAAQDAAEQTAGPAAQRKPQTLSEKGTFEWHFITTTAKLLLVLLLNFYSAMWTWFQKCWWQVRSMFSKSLIEQRSFTVDLRQCICAFCLQVEHWQHY